MTFLEMKKRGLELAKEYEDDPRVQLVAGLRDDAESPWEVYSWPWPVLKDEGLMLRLDSLHARHAAAVREGAPLPWFVKDSNEAVVFLRVEPGAQVIPLPATPAPVLMNPAAVAAALCSEARALADACRALAAKLERLAGRLEP